MAVGRLSLWANGREFVFLLCVVPWFWSHYYKKSGIEKITSRSRFELSVIHESILTVTFSLGKNDSDVT